MIRHLRPSRILPAAQLATESSLRNNFRPKLKAFAKRLSRRRPSSLPQQRIRVGCLEKYTRVTDPEVLTQSYDEAYQAIDKGGSLTDAGIQAQLADLVKTDPHAKNARPSDFFDASIIDELHKEGFVKALWSGK